MIPGSPSNPSHCATKSYLNLTHILNETIYSTPHYSYIFPLSHFQRNSRAKGIIILRRTENACGRLALVLLYTKTSSLATQHNMYMLSFIRIFTLSRLEWKVSFASFATCWRKRLTVGLELIQRLYSKENVTVYNISLYDFFQWAGGLNRKITTNVIYARLLLCMLMKWIRNSVD